jgi:FHA domain/Double zinc ribbon
MSFRCPQGHESSTADFCDVCGDPITASAPTPPVAPPATTPASSLRLPDPALPAAAALVCPSCSTDNPPDALFCEACGYDFTTGQSPAPNSPAANQPASGAAGPEWMAELWIDPDWFAHQQAPGGPPTSGAPATVALRADTIAIGRRSASRQLYPEIDCSGDGAVSHRHAQLILDHDRWYVEDLGSTNGTFVGSPGESLPDTPLDPHLRRELEDDERVYVGAWTRIMVRRATAGERSGAST